MADDITNLTNPNDGTGAASAAPDSVAEVVRERGITTKIQERGLELARTADVEPQGGGIWTVGDCIVNFKRKTGTCAAFRKSQPRTRCSHWWAVAYTIDPPEPEELVVPTVVSVPAIVTAPASPSSLVISKEMPSVEELARIAREKVKGGYTRFASLYEEHLRTEYLETMFLLKHLLPQLAPVLDVREQKQHGRKLRSLDQLLFAALLHAHHNWPFRRTEGMLAFYADPRVGFIAPDFPGFNLIDQFVRDPLTTQILRDLLALTAEPFRQYGPMTLAGDGTGMSTNRFDDWMVEGKHHIESRGTRGWRKAHVVCDVDTLAVVSAFVTDKDVSEKRIIITSLIPELVAREYDVEKFLLDGGYNATEIRDLVVDALGATPYVPWGSRSKRAISLPWRDKVKHGPLIEQIYSAFKTDEGKAFKEEYRYRVKVENLFSSIKTRFGGSVRATHDSGPENEVLLKLICHNVHMLLLAAKVYGLDPTFGGGSKAA